MEAEPPRRAGTRRGFLAAAGGAVGATLAGCLQRTVRDGTNGPGGGLSGEVKIAGSSTVFPVATQMKQAFQAEHPDVSIPIQSTGSGGGFKNHFCPGRTDFNNASRPITESEAELCAANGVEPIELKIATDALTVVVNNEADWLAENCLTVEQLARIWGAADPPQTWREVDEDWPDEPFDLFGPTEASGTYDYFIEAVLGEEGPGHRQDYQATEQDRNIINGVANNTHAIGYLGFAYYTENADAVTAVGIDDGDGCVEPTLSTAKSGEYSPLSRPLFTYPKKAALARPSVREFARFWVEHSTSTELIAERVGYVPLSPEERDAQMGTLLSAIEEVT